MGFLKRTNKKFDYQPRYYKGEGSPYKIEHKFEYNERIVVLHNDTEYFYYGCLTGFTTYNFFNLVKSLNLPHYIFIFLTNHSKYLEAVTPFITRNETVPEIHNTIVNQYSFKYINNIINLDDPKDIKYHGVCLLGTVRSHRIKLFQFFSNNNINNIRYTFNNPNAILSLNNPKSKN